jgi:hypothetical protein
MYSFVRMVEDIEVQLVIVSGLKRRNEIGERIDKNA